MNLREVRAKKEEEKSEKMKILSEKIKNNRIDYIVEIILKEVRKEQRLVRQLLYTIFSAYTPDPINVAINSPTGEGKTYTLHGVVKYFPKTDIQILSGMSEKSIFHMEGDIVVMESDDEYVPISKYLDTIQLQIDDLKDELKKAKDEEKSSIRSKIRILENELDDVAKQAIKRIVLSNKVLIFQDTPKPELLEAMMPLLSHDEFRVHYKYVSKNNNNLVTTSNMLEGYPCVIYCQAIDTSNRERAAELQRRFITYNPEMTDEKYKEAIEHIFNSTLPDTLYESEVVTTDEKDTVQALIYDIIKKIKLQSLGKTRNIVIIPFWKSLYVGFSGNSSFDMNISDKMKKYLTLIPIVNIDDRPHLQIGEGEFIPFCTFKDLEETLYLNEFMYGGIRQYILEWYIKVFYNVWLRNKKTGKQTETTKYGTTVTEDKTVVHIKELISMTKEVYNQDYTHSTLRKKYLDTLIYNGYVDEYPSNIKPNEKVFYPTSQKVIERYNTDEEGKVRLTSKIIITYDKELVYPSQRYLYSMIKYIVSCYPNSKIVDCDKKTELTVDQLIDKYYNNPEQYFKTDDKYTDSELSVKIGKSINVPITTVLDSFVVHEVMVCEKCKTGGILKKDMENHLEFDCKDNTVESPVE